MGSNIFSGRTLTMSITYFRGLPVYSDSFMEYINMCTRATEIQKTWQPEPGDSFYIAEGSFSMGEPAEIGESHYKGEIVHANELDVPKKDATYPVMENGKWTTTKDIYIWLPRQEQLQGMIDTTDPIILLDEFCSFIAYADWGMPLYQINKYGKKPIDKVFTSMEQLWLAYIMQTKYHKTWDGVGWIA